jgi:5,10-methylenetetrahydromethanopterin reductase
MKIGITSRVIVKPKASLEQLVSEAKRAEERGFAFYSLPNIFGHDAIIALSLAGRETSRIELTTGVVPSPLRHPVALAQQAMSAQVACGGRFVLGIGLSHQIVIETMMGLSYQKPAAQMREYLEVLVPLLQGQPAAFQGEHYRVSASLQAPDAQPVSVIVAALGPMMLRLTGRLADGTATWMTGFDTLARHTVPTINKAAEEAGRPAPRIVCALPIALTEDPNKARERAGRIFQVYGGLPSYRAMLDREKAAGPADVALVGDESALRSHLRRLEEVGVTDFAATPFPADEGAVERTLDFLQGEL